MEEIKFKVLELVDVTKQGSDLEIGNIYIGQRRGNSIYYRDRAGCDWIFYIDDTCEIV